MSFSLPQTVSRALGYSVLFATALAPVAPATAQTSTAGAERIDRYLRESMSTFPVPGLAAVVVQDDAVVLSAGYGYADREAGRPMTSDTPLAIGSTTKGMTALAVMQLVEQGRVDLDTPIIQYLPDFTMADPRSSEITLRQVLSMSSGLPAANVLDGNQDPDALEHEIAGLATVSLHRDPGTGYEYANDGFNLAGLLVQRMSGQTYEEYIADHVFGPLGMGHSTLDAAHAPDLAIAQGYGHHRGETVPLQTPFTRGYNPTGGVVTTADDVGRYFRALLAGGTLEDQHVLSSASVQAMWTPTFRTGDTSAVGLGWMLEDVDGQHGWTWTCDIGTFSSVFLVLPERHLSVAVMANYDAPGLMNQLARGMVSIALGGSADPLPRSVPVNVTPTVEPDRTSWDSFAGLYAARGCPRVRGISGDPRLIIRHSSG